MLTRTELEIMKQLGAELFHLRRHKKRAVGREGSRMVWHRRRGWTLLGSGHYGEAWSHCACPDSVVKISGPASWGKLGREHYRYNTYALDAWPVFARHCMAHPHKNLPAILHFEQVSPSMAWAIMPRYGFVESSMSENFRRKVSDALRGLNPVHQPAADEWLWPLRQMCDALEFTVDVHHGNVMRDTHSNEFILTDPFST